MAMKVMAVKSGLLLCLAATTAFSTDLVNVTFRSEPPGALILIGSTMSGRTPAIVRLMPGRYHAVVSLPHFEDWTGDFNVEPEKPIEVQATLPKKETERPKPGTPATPPGAIPVFAADGGAPSSMALPIDEPSGEDADKE